MKKFPKPWYRPSRGTWYVTFDGQQHNLGPDQDRAFEKYKQLLNQPKNVKPASIPSDHVVALIDKFLDWCSDHRAKDTYEWYRWRLQLSSFPVFGAYRVPIRA
jgi:hypothetical protein